MQLVKTFWAKEKGYFKKLSKEGQHMLTSIFLYNTMDPLIWTFIVAFLWRLSNSVVLIASYYIAIFIGLVIGFYFNGKLLNKFSSSSLYMIGCIAQGCMVAILVFFSFTFYPFIFFMGLIVGVAAGFFWSNRNFLTLRITETDQRIYFTSLETTSGILTNLIVPALAGGFIILGSKIHLYSPHIAYEILALIVICVMTLTGLLAKDVVVNVPPIKKITITSPSRNWYILRLFTYITGIFSGVDLILPTILILTFIGSEGSLGLLQSISSVISAFVLYSIGKKATNRHRIYIFAIGVICAIVGWGFFGITFSAIGVLVYMACNALGDPFRILSINPITYDLTDHEQSHRKEHFYCYVFDQELFLNLGRMSGLLVFILILTFLKNEALRISPFFFACSQGILLFLAMKIEKVLGTHTPSPDPLFEKEAELSTIPSI